MSAGQARSTNVNAERKIEAMKTKQDLDKIRLAQAMSRYGSVLRGLEAQTVVMLDRIKTERQSIDKQVTELSKTLA